MAGSALSFLPLLVILLLRFTVLLSVPSISPLPGPKVRCKSDDEKDRVHELDQLSPSGNGYRVGFLR